MGSYRTSHSSPGYGRHYDSLYDRGYELAQWTMLEVPLLRSLFRRLHDDGARRVLDFACGTGRILALEEELFPTTWGVDISEPMLEVARQRCPRSRLVHRDLTREPLAERFDVVTAFRFFLGAEPELRREALSAIAGLLDDGGLLVANIHVNASSPLGVAYRVANRIRPGWKRWVLGYPAFRRLVEEHGFRVEEVRHYSYLPRTGPWLTWLPALGLRPVEAVCTRLSFMRWAAQSVLLVCRRDSSARSGSR